MVYRGRDPLKPLKPLTEPIGGISGLCVGMSRESTGVVVSGLTKTIGLFTAVVICKKPKALTASFGGGYIGRYRQRFWFQGLHVEIGHTTGVEINK